MTAEEKIKTHVSERKKATVKGLKALASKNDTVMILNIKGMSSAQFQQIRKKFRDEITIQVVKKNVAARIFDGNIETERLVPILEQSSTLLFSNTDPFELAIKFCEERIPARAKPGQLAPEDISVETGPTNLMAGPALSDLSKVGLKVGVEGGKIAVKERKVLVKKGEKISADIANVLLQLEILPFSAGVEPVAAYDSKSMKVYNLSGINKKDILNSLRDSKAKAFALAVKIVYVVKETIGMLLAKAEREFNKINSLPGGSNEAGQ